MTTPKFFGNTREVLFPYHSATNTFQTVDQFRKRNLGRVSDKQMYMVILAIELYHLGFKINAHGFKYGSHELKDFFSEHATPVFSDKDQVYMQIINAMPTCSYLIIHVYRPIENIGYNSSMKTIRKAFKFRLNTTPEIEHRFTQFADASRFIWNKALGINLYRLNNGYPIIWLSEMQFWLGIWKSSDELAFLKDVHSQSIQAPLRNLDRAFKDCFDKTQTNKRCPTFKKKGVAIDSFSYPQGFKIDQELNKIFLPKIGWVTYRNSRKIVGVPKNITVSRKGVYWYVSIQVEYDAMSLTHKSTSDVGIDMGIKRFATLSDGTVYNPLNSFKGKAEKLAKFQRKLKNKKKFSSNWKKVKAKITKCHEDIANARKDYLHKVSTEVCENQAMIFVEDLKIKNMSKSAIGTLDKPGKKVAQKSGLNKAILDQGWSMFFQMLEYKQDWNGGMVLKVPPHHTSQKCPACHHTSVQNRLTQADFVCTKCGFTANADDVGSINVRTRGHMALASRELACEVNGAVMPSAAGTSGKQRCKTAPGKTGITVSLGR